MSTQAVFYLNSEQRKIFENLLDRSEIEPSKQKKNIALVSDEEELANMYHWLED